MKSDYNKSMLRLGAVVVASASILGASAAMNAAPMASPLPAPVPAADDAAEMSENELAFNNDIAKINTLQEKLTDVLKTLEANYPTFDEGYAMANHINSEILKMQESCVDAFDELGEGDVYVSPLTDVWEQEMDSDIDEILYQADQDRIAKNAEAYGKYMTTLSDLQEELSAACGDESLDYYPYLNRGQVEAIYNELETLYDEAEKYYAGVQESGVFDLDVNEDAHAIRALIAEVVEKAQKAYEGQRVAANEEAFGKYMTELSLLQEELSAVVNNPEYADFINRGLAESIYNELETLYNDAEKYYEGVQEAGVFDLSITDDAAMIRGAIAKLEDQALKAYEANRVEKNAEAYGKYMTELSLLQQELSTACLETHDYAQYINRGLAESIYNELETLYNDAEKYYDGVQEAGWFDLDITDVANSIRGAIADLVNKAKAALAGDNQAAFEADYLKIQLLQEKLTQVISDLNADYPAYAEEKGLQEAHAISGRIEQMMTACENALEEAEGGYVSPLTDAWEQEIDSDIDEILYQANQDRIEKNKVAYGNYMTELSLLQQELTEAILETHDYAPFINRGLAESIYTELETLYNDAEKYYAGVEESGWFDLSITDDAVAIRGAIADMVEQAQKAAEGVRVANNEAAYGAYMTELSLLQEELSAVANNPEYADYINRGLAESIYNELETLYNEAEKYYAGVQEAGVFDLSIEDDAVSIRGAIAKLEEQAQKALEANRVEKNEEAYGKYMTTLSDLQEELSAVVNNPEYADYINRGLAESIYNELETLYNEAEKYYAGVQEAGWFDLSIEDDAVAIRGAIAKLEEQALKALESTRVANNEAAYGAYMTELSLLQEELSEACLETHDYAPFIDRGLAESIYNELETLYNEAEKYYAGVQEAGVFDLSIADDAVAIRGAIARLVERAQKAYEAQRVAMNDEAYGKYMTELSLLQQELSEACLETHDYAPYLNRGLVESIYNELETLYNEAEKYYASVEEAGVFDLTIDDVANSVRGAIANLVDAAKKALEGESTRNAENLAAYNVVCTEIEALRAELAAAIDEDNDYAKFLNRGKVEAIESAIGMMQDEADAELEAVKEEGNYGYAGTEDAFQIRAMIDALVQDAQKAANADRVEKNAEAYGKYMSTLSALQEELTAVVNNPEYADVINRGLAESIYNELETLYNDAEKYYAGVEEAGWFDLSIDDEAVAIRGAIAKLEEQALKALDSNRVANNEAAYGAYMTELSLLQEELSAVVNNPAYADYINRGLAESIYNELETLYNEAEKYYAGVQEAGVFDLSLADDAVAIRGAIAKLEEQALKALESNRVAANEEAYGKYMTELSLLQEELSDAVNNQEYSDFINRGLAESIYNELETLYNEAEKYYAGVQEAGVFDLDITDDANAIRGAIAKMVEQAQKAYEAHRVEMNEVAYGAYMTELSLLQEELSDAVNNREYSDYINRGLAESIYNELETLYNEAEKYYAGVQEAGVFDLSIADDAVAIRGAIAKMVEQAQKAYEANRVERNEAAYGKYMTELSLLQEELSDAVNNQEYSDYINRGLAESIYNELETLYNEAEKYYAGVQEAGVFDLDITNDANAIRGAIAQLVEKAQQAYNENRVAMNEAAYGAYMTELSLLQEELSEACLDTHDYAPYINRGLAESIYNELVSLYEEAEKYYIGVQEAGVFDLSIEDDANAIRGAIAKMVENAQKALNGDDRVKNNMEAYSNVLAEIMNLRDELAKAISEDNDYAKFLNRGKVEAIESAIDEMQDEADIELAAVETEGNYGYTGTEDAYQIRGMIAAVVESAQKALENERVELNKEAYGKYMTTLSDLQEELSAACGDESLDYYPYINRGQVEAIYNELETLYNEAEKYYAGVEEAGWFDLDITEDAHAIRARIAMVVEKAQKAYEDQRVADNNEAYGKYMTELSLLQEELSAACAETNDYAPFINRGLAESIYNELETLYNDAEKYYLGVQEAGVFDLDITDDANAIRGAIAKLVEQAQKAYEGNRVELNKEAYGKYMTELSALQEELSAACGDETLDYYPYLNRGQVEAIYNELETLYNEAEKYYAGVEEAGVFDLDITEDAHAIRARIAMVVEKAQKACEDQRAAANAEAYGKYMTELSLLQQELTEAILDTHDYAPYINRGLAESIYNELETLYNDAEKYYLGVQEAGVFDLSIDDDAAMIRGMIAKMVDTAKKVMEGDERVVGNMHAYNAVLIEIMNLRTELAEAISEDNDYAKFLNRGRVEAIESAIDAIMEEADLELAAVEDEGTFNYTVTEDAYQIRGMIDAVVEAAQRAMEKDRVDRNAEAYGKYMTTLSDLQEELSAVVNNPEYADYINRGLAESIYNELENLYNDAEKYYAGVEEAGVFDLSIEDDAVAIRGAIAKLEEQALKALNANRVAANEEAYGKYMTELSLLQEELSEACLDTHDYAPFINRGLAESIYNELETLYNEAEMYYQGVQEAGVFDLDITEDANAIRGAIAKLVEAAQKAMENERVALNDEAYGKDITMLVQMQQDLTAAWEEIQKTSETFYESEMGKAMVQNIYAQLEDMHAAVEAAYAEVENEGTYVSPITDTFEDMFASDIEELQYKAQVFADNYAAMQKDSGAVTVLMEQVWPLGDELDSIDASWMEDEKAADMWNKINDDLSRYFNDVMAAYQSSLKTGEYIAPFDTEELDAVSALMDELRTYVKTKADGERDAYNKAAYGNDMTKLQNMQEILSNTWNELQDTCPYYTDSESGNEFVQAIYDSLQNMYDAVEAEYADVENGGMYVSPITGTFEDMFSSDVEELKYLAEKAQGNWDAYQADYQTYESCYRILMAGYAEMDAKNPDWYENEAIGDMESQIWALLDEWFGASNEAWWAYEAGDAEDYVSPYPADAEEIIAEMVNNMVNSVESGVSAIGADTKTEVYTIDGHKTNSIARGKINIVREGNKYVKVIVK